MTRRTSSFSPRQARCTFGLLSFLLVTAAGCLADDADGGRLGTQNTVVTGRVLGYFSGAPVPGAVLRVPGAAIPLNATADDQGMFNLTVPIGSTFQIEASSATGFLTTLNASTVSGQPGPVTIYLVGVAQLQQQALATGQTLRSGTSLAIVELLRDDGTPRAGIPLDNILIDPPVSPAQGPYFIGDGIEPAAPESRVVGGRASFAFLNLPRETFTVTVRYPANDVDTGPGNVGPRTAQFSTFPNRAVVVRVNDPAQLQLP